MIAARRGAGAARRTPAAAVAARALNAALVRAALLAALVATSALAAEPEPPSRLERRVGDCVLVAPPEASRALENLASRAESVLPEVVRDLGTAPRGPYTMVLIPAGTSSDTSFRALDRRAPAWAAGFMDPVGRIGAIRLAQAARYPYGTPEAVLAHETAHQILHDVPGLETPLWFEEGVCTWVAREWQLEDLVLLSGRTLTRDLPRLDALESMFHGSSGEADEAYATAFAYVSWCVRRYGDTWPRDVIAEARTHSFERAFRLVTGVALDRSEATWRRESVFRYRWLPIITASSTLWLIVMLLSAWVWARRRRRAKALEASWDEEEAETTRHDWEWRIIEDDEEAVGESDSSRTVAEDRPTTRDEEESGRSP